MRYRFISLLLFIFIFNVVNAQEIDQDKTLFQIGNEKYSVEGFLENYNKNLDLVIDDSQKTIDNYFQLYINYNLKLKEAKALGLDTSKAYLKDYNKYYKQLADNFIANGEITKAMLKETYNRYKTEVKASHILISNSSKEVADTLKAYQKAEKVRRKLLAGEDFDKVALQFSEDPSVKMNDGNLGWFRAFKMIYPFENAVYNMQIGDISKPIKTQFGYHIIKKTGERASKGKITVSHIMLKVENAEQDQEAEKKIQQLHQKLDLDNFAEMAKQYSDDENTAQNGGQLKAFSISEINSKRFENAAFNLEEIGDISEPIKTKFGWHVLMLNDIEPLASYEEMKPDIRRQVKTSTRAKLINEQISEDLQKRYQAQFDDNYKEKLYQIIENTMVDDKFKIDNIKESNALPSRVLFEFANQKYTYKDYLKYFEKNQLSFAAKATPKQRIDKTYSDFLYNKLVAHHRDELESINADFANSVKTYRDGILLFEVMKNQVWEPVSNDTLGQQKHYEKHLQDFYSEESVQAKIFTSSDKKNLRKFRKSYKKNTEKAMSALTQENAHEIMIDKGEITVNSSKIPSSIFSTKKISSIKKHNGGYVFIDVEKRFPAKQLELNNVKGEIINLMQKHKEDEWIKSLRKKYTISVNEDVLKTIKQTFE
ncbi:MAG: peptidylprolyl isomerase [Psychroflexus halocasei]